MSGLVHSAPNCALAERTVSSISGLSKLQGRLRGITQLKGERVIALSTVEWEARLNWPGSVSSEWCWWTLSPLQSRINDCIGRLAHK